MNQDIREGRWMKFRGRAKRAVGRIIGDSNLAAEGNADVVAGALQESIGQARQSAVRELDRGVDVLAGYAKKAARTLDR
ncbi:MAG: CsbD family protein [Gemmatimonadales bacterium]